MPTILTKQARWAWTIFLLYGLLIATFSAISPWVGDDIEYAFVASPTETNPTMERVESLSDIVRSQVNHYQSTNGRTVAHVLVQGFCGLWGQAAFSVANGIVAVVFLFLLMFVGNASIRSPQQCFVALLLAVSPFYLYYTPCCQIGFVWMACLAMLALWFFENPPAHMKWAILLLLLGIVAGWGQEALTFGLCGGIWLQAVRGRVRTLGAWMLLVGFTIGCALIALSPGAWARAADVDVAAKDSLLMLFTRLRTFYVLLLFVLYLAVRRIAMPWRVFAEEPLLFFALLCAFAFNIFIGVVGSRQLFGIEVFSMLLVLRMLNRYSLPSGHISAVVGVLTFAATFMLLRRGDYLIQTRRAYDRTMELAERAPDGAVVLHRYVGGDALWPGDQFLGTMEKKIRSEMGKDVHLVPAESYENNKASQK